MVFLRGINSSLCVILWALNAKMYLLDTIFILLVALFLVKSEDVHHIDQRILEDESLSNLIKTNFNTTISNVTSTAVVPTLEQVLPNNSYQAAIILGHQFKPSVSNKSGSVSVAGNVSALIRKDDLFIISNSTKNETIAEGKLLDTEVADLLHSDKHPFEPEEPLHIPDKIDKQVEYVEDGKITEDELRKHIDDATYDYSHGLLAIILVTSFVVMAILCYVVLLLWRRYLEDRYGSRTLLVDAEEFHVPNDLKHFSI